MVADVELCAGRLDAEVERLLELRDTTTVRGLSMPEVVDDLAHAIAEESGRPAEVLRRVLALIARRELGEVVELVECRHVVCPVRRETLLSYVGVGCASCGRPLTRVVGPASAGECPPWCMEHPAQHEDLFTHARTLLDGPDVSVWLEDTIGYDPEADLLTRTGPLLVVDDAEDTIRVPAGAGTLDALIGAVRDAQRLLTGVAS